MTGHGCIDADNVPCEKVRDYLRRNGLLCRVKKQPKPRRADNRSWLDKWFG